MWLKPSDKLSVNIDYVERTCNCMYRVYYISYDIKKTFFSGRKKNISLSKKLNMLDFNTLHLWKFWIFHREQKLIWGEKISWKYAIAWITEI